MSIEVTGIPELVWWAVALWLVATSLLHASRAYLTYLNGRQQRQFVSGLRQHKRPKRPDPTG